MEACLKDNKRTANLIRIYVFANMSCILYFVMMKFKRNGLPCSRITIISLFFYATAVPLAHVAHLQTIHARSSDMRIVQLVTFEYLTGFLTTLLTLLFLSPAVYGAYGILCQNGTLGAECGLSTPLIQLSCHSIRWGIMSLLMVDYSAIVMALAMLFTPTSFVKVGSFLSYIFPSFIEYRDLGII